MTRTILGFGASSMEGVGDDASGGFFRRLEATLTPHRFVNLGLGGDTTRDMLRRCTQAEAHRPYDLIVLPGCNDFPRANDPLPQARTELAEYGLNLAKLLEALRGARNVFVTPFQVDPELSGVSEQTFHRYVRRARDLAEEAGYEVVDLYTLTKTSGRELLASDGLHFGPAGHQLIARLLAPLL